MLKKISSYDQHKTEKINIESIKHLSSKEQCELIADKFSKISQEYDPLVTSDIKLEHFEAPDVPKFSPKEVQNELEQIKTNKATPPGDIPPKLVKIFPSFLSIPLCDILNTTIRMGEWSKLYKCEYVTPIPKVFPPKSIDEMRNISGLLLFDKIAEKLIGNLIVSDMSEHLDLSQFANQKGISLQHYLIKMINQILSDTDKSSKDEVNAVIAVLYDWKEAFPRQCPKLGVEAFQKCGVRPSLIPLIINYLQNRTMKVKWHGEISTERHLNGGGPQGATFGIWEYLAQSNNNADCVDPNYRFKFVDDLTVLEKINLLIVGLTSFHTKQSVPSDVLENNLIIPAENLNSQNYLNEIKKWTDNQKMILNQKKTKVMIFNFTNNYQFTTRLKLNDETLEIVNKTKLLGVIFTDDLKWDENVKYLVKRAYQKMQILRIAATFGASIEEKREIYILYVRSTLEQSCVVWSSRLTAKNIIDLERVQKAAIRIILNKTFENYDEALERADLQNLEKRREMLCLKFAKNSTKNDKTDKFFPLKNKKHKMKKRINENFLVKFAKTERFKKSSIPYMQRLLNKNNQEYHTKII